MSIIRQKLLNETAIGTSLTCADKAIEPSKLPIITVPDDGTDCWYGTSNRDTAVTNNIDPEKKDMHSDILDDLLNPNLYEENVQKLLSLIDETYSDGIEEYTF